MDLLNVSFLNSPEIKEEEEVTLDGTVNRFNQPALRRRTGTWVAATLLLVNQGLGTLAFYGVGCNLVLFLTRVMGQDNADAANTVSLWVGSVYIFALMGAFISDSYWGRYKTCATFQAISLIGLVSLSLSCYMFLVKPSGCGDKETSCESHSGVKITLFYVSIALIALGNGGYQPNIITFGADQFDGDHPKEAKSKVAYFGYFYLVANLGALFSSTVLGYFENEGMWAVGFGASAASACVALCLFLVGTPRYRHFTPKGNPFSRFFQVIVAAIRNRKVQMPDSCEQLYEGTEEASTNGCRKILHTHGFKFLDRAAVVTPDKNEDLYIDSQHICSVTQVEEVKCILRLLPIWLCTILYFVVFSQMASLFVEQGAAMKNTISNFNIPPASMSSFEVLSVVAFVFIYPHVLDPLVARMKKNSRPHGLTELQRMGIGLVLAIMAMTTAGTVEHFRLKNALQNECINCKSSSGSLSILWQIPQYALIGASEVFMYVCQLEFFNGQAPDGLKSFGTALCMTSISLGNYMNSFLITIVMKITAGSEMPGWIPENLNNGHLDRFFFMLAALTTADLAVYIVCAKWYKYSKFEGDLV